MSDRPEDSRPASETGGWFVPKNAMSEQQIAASATDKQAAAHDAAMPNATPVQAGSWYSPPEAGGSAPAMSAADPAASAQPAAPTEPAPEPVAVSGPPTAAPLPAGAGISTEVDY